MKKNIYIFISIVVTMLLFQNCGIQTLDSTDSSTGPDVLGIQVVGLPVAPEPGLKQSYLAESSDAPIYKLEITDINQELLVYVPSSLLSAINFSDVDTINWKFEHAAGGEVAIDLVGRAIDLSELDVDLDLFLNGTLKAVLADGSNIALFYIVEKDETEVPDFIQSIIIDVPVVGLKPPEVVGEPIRQTMGMPVAPEVVGEPIRQTMGIPVAPEVVGEPIRQTMGIPVAPEVVGEPIRQTMGIPVAPEVVGEPIRQTMGMPVAPEVLGKPYSEK